MTQISQMEDKHAYLSKAPGTRALCSLLVLFPIYVNLRHLRIHQLKNKLNQRLLR